MRTELQAESGQDGRISVQVVRAAESQVLTVAVWVPAAATVSDALGLAGAAFKPEAGEAIGIWGRVSALSTVLQANDRIEIYRPLRADAKQRRRARAELARKARHDRGAGA